METIDKKLKERVKTDSHLEEHIEKIIQYLVNQDIGYYEIKGNITPDGTIKITVRLHRHLYKSTLKRIIEHPKFSNIHADSSTHYLFVDFVHYHFETK